MIKKQHHNSGVAAVQAAPVFLDLEATVAKTITLIESAAKHMIMKQDYCCDSEVCIEKENICEPSEKTSTAINIDTK
ncbi:hypothetical protein [Photorhabdus luminescens]|uniref:Uncharacterized protein n=1 Tax=Photorhabdus luminescens subsp. sonorensis TaxID=1173677 RepID=A0A5C4RDN6_PHOLU|nr:hypothetical protein [Photorhabdus luminescens]TNH41727.1 hypothetical protein EP164_20985 [Photorhabdus luminescens subsp. sonorensis]